jgi:hypothetical protein
VAKEAQQAEESQADKSTTRSQGKQEIQKGGDYNAHKAYGEAQGTKNSRQGVNEKTPYKHR